MRANFKARILLVPALAALLASAFLFGRSLWHPIYLKVKGRQTVAEVIAITRPAALARLEPYFRTAGVRYPPTEVTLLALKDSARMEVWVGTERGPFRVRTYSIQALSGSAGPKLREGDRQVPEGIYKIEALNPNSSFHLSIKLNYPNAFDMKYARLEGRTSPGSDIFIHGNSVSVGCLAMGDETIEELFVLVHDVGLDRVRVVIAPTDPRTTRLTAQSQPSWVADLYRAIEKEFRAYAPATT